MMIIKNVTTAVMENTMVLVYLLFGFLGVMISILNTKTGGMSRKDIFLTIMSGLACSFLVPEAIHWYFDTDAAIIGYIGAFVGGLLGMRIVISILQIDVVGIVNRFTWKKHL